MAINWFPGHMAKTLRDIQNVKEIDMIIEVIDARAIKTSSNPELTLGFNKPKLRIALKSDMADLNRVGVPADLLIGSVLDRGFKNRIINKINDIFEIKFNKLKTKGLLNPQICILVVGLPNVGKSSLINFLSSGSKLIVANKPGVTRTKQLVQINKTIYMYDTPGVFVKRISSNEEGYKLALINAIRREVLPLNEVVEWAYQYFMKYYHPSFYKKYQVSSQLSYTELLNHICKMYQFYLKENIPDTNRAIDFLYKEITEGKVVKINYEKEI